MCPAVKNFLFLHLLASIGTLYIPVPMEFLPSKGGILLSHVPMYILYTWILVQSAVDRVGKGIVSDRSTETASLLLLWPRLPPHLPQG